MQSSNLVPLFENTSWFVKPSLGSQERGRRRFSEDTTRQPLQLNVFSGSQLSKRGTLSLAKPLRSGSRNRSALRSRTASAESRWNRGWFPSPEFTVLRTVPQTVASRALANLDKLAAGSKKKINKLTFFSDRVKPAAVAEACSSAYATSSGGSRCRRGSSNPSEKPYARFWRPSRERGVVVVFLSRAKSAPASSPRSRSLTSHARRGRK